MDLVRIQAEHSVVYWGTCLYLQNRSNVQVSDLVRVILNQWVVGPCFVFSLHNVGWLVLDSTDATQPLATLGYLMVYYLVLCVSFYVLHRLAHSRTFCHGLVWRTIHMLHHTYSVPAPCGAFYCHPLEHIGMNLLPVLLGPMCLPTDMFTVRIWFALCTFSSVVAHDGAGGPHGLHHLRPDVNFGVGTWLDTLAGTSGDLVPHDGNRLAT